MFWGRFEDLCKNIGKAPNAVAKELGVPSGSVTAWKKGSTPRNETLVKIASYFDVTVDYLSGSEQKENPTVSGEVNYSDMELLSAFNSADEATKQAIRLILGLK